MSEAHNHKPILPDTLLCLCLSPHGHVGITSTAALGSSSYVQHPTSRVLSAGAGSRWKGSLECVGSPCSVSTGPQESLVLQLCVLWLDSLLSKLGALWAASVPQSFSEKLCFSGCQTCWKAYSVCPVISCFGAGRCVGTQHLTVFRS